jgi:HlyD family type I secretion membrane fusion protein
VTRLALAARLEAERDGLDAVVYPEALPGPDAPRGAADAMRVQSDVFAARHQALTGQTQILNRRIEQTEAEIAGLSELVAIQDAQIAQLTAQLAELEDDLAQGIITRTTVDQFSLQLTNERGERATNFAAIASAETSILELQQQILDLSTERLNEVVSQLSNVEAELFDLEQQLRSAQDILSRLSIRAPVTGTVVGLAVHTEGAVVAPGEALLYVVPSEGILQIEARVRPEDVDVLSTGQAVDVRISAFDSANLPRIVGELTTISADRLTDPTTGIGYFTVRVTVSESELAKLGGNVIPGMSAEVIIRTGTRTLLQYLGDPLMDRLRRSLRET